ncbi:MAG: hypothetical protein ACRDUS_20495 [Mycobacterium sp.]
MRHDDLFDGGTSRTGRIADHHMWEVYGGHAARAQAFRDESGGALALITLRVGDRVVSYVNEAETVRERAREDLFPHDSVPPVLIFNVLNPLLRFSGSSAVRTVDFHQNGDFHRIQDTAPADVDLLNRLGAEWDEGSGFVPYVTPPRTDVLVVRRIPVSELPASDTSQDMTPFMAVDWSEATAIAIRAGRREDIPEGLPEDIADAAGCLFYDSMGLIREPGQEVRWMNGQHRGEAMRRQGVEETIVQEKRRIDAPPLPGELRQIIAL